jgi:hypothetical protein
MFPHSKILRFLSNSRRRSRSKHGIPKDELCRRSPKPRWLFYCRFCRTTNEKLQYPGEFCYNLPLRESEPNPGEMDERFKSHAWKACIG